jgi:hypothetical protein
MRRAALLGLLLAALNSSTHAAESETLLILGDRIDRLEQRTNKLSPDDLINRYYALLDSDRRRTALSLRQTLFRLSPRYRVAFAAGDTAELNNIVSDIGRTWARLRTLHAAEYTAAAITDLESAYSQQFSFLAD